MPPKREFVFLNSPQQVVRALCQATHMSKEVLVRERSNWGEAGGRTLGHPWVKGDVKQLSQTGEFFPFWSAGGEEGDTYYLCMVCYITYLFVTFFPNYFLSLSGRM